MMEVHEIGLSYLVEYENNPRNNDSAVEAVAESIKQFGFKVPIIVDKDNVIVAGHTRLKAARLIGLDKVPCIVADDLTPEQIKAFRLADNKVGELACWDFAKLEEKMAGLSFDMTVFRFDEMEEISMDELDKEDDKTGGVQITIKFENIKDWQCIETEIKYIAETNNGSLSVRMV